MKILFLTIIKIDSLDERGIYTDLLRKFRDEGHEVVVICPVERRYKIKTNIIYEKGASILQVTSLNVQKANMIEKGIGILALEYQYLRALKRNFSKEKFDLVLYSTPPITFSKVIQFIKRRDHAYSYLLLKDIFPQNAIDLGLMKKDSLLHKFFIKKERKLYTISDSIGCMSEANKEYIIKHNSDINPRKVEVNPNSIEPKDRIPLVLESKKAIRRKYNLPIEKFIFIYGGNLGLPQGIDFLLNTIESCQNPNIFFLIVGSGREFVKVESYFAKNKPKNAMLLEGLAKKDYDILVGACDVGMIFLSPHFTIPNFPSRLLTYLEFGMPVLAAIDKSTDIGIIIEEANCGRWVHSGDMKTMLRTINNLIEKESDFSIKQENARKLLENNYLVNNSYELIRIKLDNDLK